MNIHLFVGGTAIRQGLPFNIPTSDGEACQSNIIKHNSFNSVIIDMYLFFTRY